MTFIFGYLFIQRFHDVPVPLQHLEEGSFLVEKYARDAGSGILTPTLFQEALELRRREIHPSRSAAINEMHRIHNVPAGRAASSRAGLKQSGSRGLLFRN